ncbi:MAG: tripartite tricarboxylate transporter TctB family protein [Halomonadaceae bacterium]|uniref:Tripartite tricarboxylate transporter TctB family protein n=1 Tax=Halomonas colorata TaxID=2742615 RepID=A0ABR9FTL6_9GAMM|nr:tripartite tricarboxylate transporter TctB family protein [Halomonas colorata]MBE0461983.1 tripartite tricarboxylate transporter TctB family protein [Halomonas colorata]
MYFDDRLNGLVFILLGGVVVFLAQQLPTLTFIDYGPGFFPTLIGCVMMIAGGVIALKPLLQRGASITWAALPRARSWPQALSAIGVVVGAIAFYIATLNILGFLIAMPISLFVLLAFFDRRILRDIPIAIIGSFLLHSFFYQLMSVQLPWGLLTPFAGVLTW